MQTVTYKPFWTVNSCFMYCTYVDVMVSTSDALPRREKQFQSRMISDPWCIVVTCSSLTVTYLPHKAVAEVSKHKEPMGRRCVEFNWFKSQLMSYSSEMRVKWFGCHLIWDSSDLVVIWFEIQMILVVKWFEVQVIWMSNDLRFKWFGWQVIWDSSDPDVKCFEIQMTWLSSDLRFKWFGCQLVWDSIKSEISFSARLPWKLKLWSSKIKTTFFCETSFKIETLKLQNEAFLRDLLQNSKLEARKTKLLCETSFQNEAFRLKNLRIPMRFSDF